MRKITAGFGCSVDNYIAGRDGAVDWLRWDEEVAQIAAEYWKTIDTVIMGGRTYEAAVAMGTTSYPGAANIVFSRTLPAPASPDVRVVRDDAVEFVNRLKHSEGAGICVMGGGALVSSLLDAGLIDELGLNIHPILLGSGIPVFQGVAHTVHLECLSARQLANGCLYVLYRVMQ